MEIAVHKASEETSLLQTGFQKSNSFSLSPRQHHTIFESGAPCLWDPEEQDELERSRHMKPLTQRKARGKARSVLVPFTLLMSAIGSGTLAIPYTFVLLSKWEGVATLTMVGLSMAFTADIVLRVHVHMASQPGHDELRETFEQMARIAGGTSLDRLASCLAGFAVFGACVGCIRVVKDISPLVISLMFSKAGRDFDLLPSERKETLVSYMVWIVFLLIVLPLALFKKISALRFFSYVGFVCSLYLVGAVAYRSISDSVSYSREEANSLDTVVKLLPEVGWMTRFNEFAQCVAIYNFTFMVHLNVIPLFSQVVGEDSSPQVLVETEKKIRRNLYAVALICVVLYSIFGICAASIYGNATQGNVLLNMKHDSIMMIPRISIMLTILFSFPLLFYPLRCLALDADCFGGNPSVGVQFTTSVLLLVAQIFCAMKVPGVQVVFSLVGSSALLVICYILPGVFYWKLFPWQESSSSKQRCVVLMLLIAGTTIVCVAATVNVVAKVIRSF